MHPDTPPNMAFFKAQDGTHCTLNTSKPIGNSMIQVQLCKGPVHHDFKAPPQEPMVVVRHRGSKTPWVPGPTSHGFPHSGSKKTHGEEKLYK